ncbi:hypothetical protein PCANC_07240 [Puccinia coronata f. sp. avenae]|uniref:Uncharacterized protein n=1 Tax=Puccinia coronata f. sp. avenae TaxID=200324 RepID=A0A2N5URA1_9BASI|nr:hypothetical protein PCASD_08546 [Puccinia coronata f. sp. avenae]PLW53545.1 hypothetical protein PCANC_07240 [Puccinia coronata f. sp. avenae]
MKPKDSTSKTDSSNEKSTPHPVSSGAIPTPPVSSGANVTSLSSGDDGMAGKPKPKEATPKTKSSEDKAAIPPVSSGGSPPPGASDGKAMPGDETPKVGSGEKGVKATSGSPAKRSPTKANSSKEDAQENINDDDDDDDDTPKKGSSFNTTVAKGSSGVVSEENVKNPPQLSSATFLSVTNDLEYHLGAVGLMTIGTLLIL